MANPTLRTYFLDHPYLERRWSSSNKENLLNLTTGSNRKVYWSCLQCGVELEYSVTMMVRNPARCSVCSGKTVVLGVNDLTTTNPELVLEWGPDNESLPQEHTRSSSYSAQWVCSLCGKSWTAPVNNRSRSNHQSGCKSCNWRRKKNPPDERTLPYGEDIPDFVRSAYRDNGTIQKIGSKKERLWVCQDDLSHTWKESPFALSKRLSCPHCDNLVVTEEGRIIRRPALPSILPEEKVLCSFIDPSRISVSSSQRVTWICDKGHIWVTPVYQRTGGDNLSECMYCVDRSSSHGERELREYIDSFLPGKLISKSRKIIPPYELDIYIPEKRIAFEYNGLYWHSENNGKDRHYHYDKWKMCRDQGIQLITIWEDDWRERKDIILSMITHKLGESLSKRVFARNTEIVESSAQESREFLDGNHIQGFTQGSVYFSLMNDSNIIATSVWRKNKNTLYLDRYATSTTVIGGMGKLLKQGIQYAEDNGCTEIVTFADHQVSNGGLYEKLGFRLDKELKPDYKYVVNGQREHKFGYRLKRFRDDPDLLYQEGLSESELARLNNIARIWDCGKSRYTLVIS